mmetsp:Transcript_75466/g.157388  ORF Transcript_75466/g.157388 Transcript_75466/m.157388 type:complete len:83 (-) Transcript_75466:107-355(-)
MRRLRQHRSLNPPPPFPPSLLKKEPSRPGPVPTSVMAMLLFTDDLGRVRVPGSAERQYHSERGYSFQTSKKGSLNMEDEEEQ